MGGFRTLFKSGPGVPTLKTGCTCLTGVGTGGHFRSTWSGDVAGTRLIKYHIHVNICCDEILKVSLGSKSKHIRHIGKFINYKAAISYCS